MIPEHLFAAAARGDLETIRAYFEDDSDGVARNVDDSLGDDNDETLLLNCAGGDIDIDRMTLAHVNLARYLLSRGASIDLRNSCGNTALMRACYCGTGAVAVLDGSFKRYVREPHREFLALRGLAMRGHLAPMGTRRTRGAQKWKAAVAFLARHGDNGVVWNVLSFWRATK